MHELTNLSLLFLVFMLSSFLVADIPSVDAPGPPPKAPDKVTNLTATAVSSSQINLSWTAPNDGGSLIVGYQIERHSTEPWTIIVSNTSNTNTNYLDTGLEPNTKYLYRVSAINLDGIGHASSPANDKTFNISTETTPDRNPPEILGVGLYDIHSSDSKDSYSKLILGLNTDKQRQFEDYIPYSKNSDYTDQKNYKDLGGYDKHGKYVSFSGHIDRAPFFINTDEVLQIQVRLKDDFASTKIEHLSVYLDIRNQDNKSYPTEMIFDKGQKLQVKDPQKVIQSVQVNDFLEDDIYWVNFDIDFQKEIGLTDMFLETWNEGRNVAYQLLGDALQVSNSQESQNDAISLVAVVEMTHNTSSPVCKAYNSCFIPFDATILKGGIITWFNPDSYMHDIESGIPGKPDHRFDLHVMPSGSQQKIFPNPGIYKYFCSIHPWATGKITVVDKQQEKIIEYDEKSPPLIVASVTPIGSVMIEQNQKVLKETKDLKVEISGHIQDQKSKSVTIIIIRPDGAKEELRTSTNDRGYYFIPVTLNKKWLEGDYSIIAKFNDIKIGEVVFSIGDKK